MDAARSVEVRFIKMGNCQNCGKSIKLKSQEEKCPSCGSNPYQCWKCQNPILGSEKECPVCGFFRCSGCGICGKDCKLPILLEETKSMSHEELVEYIYLVASGKIRRTCPNLVGISYAKNKLRSIALKVDGFGTKDKEDTDKFRERISLQLNDFPLGQTWKIKEKKEPGFHGFELRETSNFLVCLGMAKKKVGKTEKGDYCEEFEKINTEPCKYANFDKLIVKYCPKCGKNYDLKCQICDFCIKGKVKKLPVSLKQRISHLDFCQLPRQDFKKQ